MQFRILGPLEVSEDGRRVDLGGPRQRALLAVLLLHANEVVSRERLIDELWGEEPPATAVKTLQTYVSRLRGAIAAEAETPANGGRLETRGHGYRLNVEPGELDAERFRELFDEARESLAGGEAEEAAEQLREALALWRGPVLADLSHDSFAQAEIGRLDELQLEALEERIEADLALGRHRVLVSELEALIAQHPLRERLRGQLMLALYRSDRQAEALRVYQDARRELAETLGLEPSESLRRLERQILEQDPALAAPPPPPRPRPIPMPQRPATRLILLGALVLAAAIVVAVFQLVLEGGAETERSAEAADGPGARFLDGRTGARVASVPLGSAPSSVAVGDGSVWVLDANDRTISKVDADTRTRVRTVSTASTPTDVAYGAGALWVGNASRDPGFAGTNYPGSVSRVDPESGVVDATVDLPSTRSQAYFQGGGSNLQHVAATDTDVWAINPDQTLSRIDPRINRRVATVRGITVDEVAAGKEGVWALSSDGVIEIDPATNTVSSRIEVAWESSSGLAVGEGAVWVGDPLGGSVWRIEPGSEPVLRQIPLQLGVRAIAFGRGALWVTNEIADRVYRIDPATNKARTVSRMVAPQSVAVGEGGVWVTALGLPTGREALPASACGRVFSGGKKPRFLIASDLPLQGGDRPRTLPLAEAIRFVLERRGFRAGKYSVGYQSCDDSTAQAGGTDVFRCFANAKAYARTVRVIGVIGAFHSFCTQFQIPIANQAPRGPLAMLSPANTVTGLTRPSDGMRPGELEDLYPSGTRNYFRIAAADHLAPIALVEAAKQLGRTRPFILWDREDYDYKVGYADDMRGAAERLGFQIAGRAGWDPAAHDFVRLAQRIAATRPDAVLMAGAQPPDVRAFLRDLRAGLGRDVALIASDGFAAFPGLIRAAGPVAQGLYVGQYGIPNEKLPPAGRRFLEAFERAYPGRPSPDFAAAYGAQSAEILLDAIARSDGTRASVTRELRRTKVQDRILGDIRFDRYGDLVEGPFTIFRVMGGEAVVDRVVIVDSTSLR